MQLSIDERVGAAHPGAAFGLLALAEAANPAREGRLEARRGEVEAELRERFGRLSRTELKAAAPLDAYCAWYGRFGRTYHVLLQLESILKGRTVPAGAALVEAMFLSELRHLLLTAGHDRRELRPPLRLAPAEGTERYVALGGAERGTQAGDLLLADGLGVVSSILGGPDQRTRLREDTREPLFFVYAPPGIGAGPLRLHLEEIERNVRLFAPAARREALEIVEAR